MNTYKIANNTCGEDCSIALWLTLSGVIQHLVRSSYALISLHFILSFAFPFQIIRILSSFSFFFFLVASERIGKETSGFTLFWNCSKEPNLPCRGRGGRGKGGRQIRDKARLNLPYPLKPEGFLLRPLSHVKFCFSSGWKPVNKITELDNRRNEPCKGHLISGLAVVVGRESVCVCRKHGRQGCVAMGAVGTSVYHLKSRVSLHILTQIQLSVPVSLSDSWVCSYVRQTE